MNRSLQYSSSLFRFGVLAVCCLLSNLLGAQSYDFTSVTIGGGGYITNILQHPENPDLKYIRTDVGGCYRWDSGNQKWIQLLTPVLNENNFEFKSVDGIAVSRTNQNLLYIAVGNTKNGDGPSDIWKSTDKGSSWQSTNFDIPEAFEGNQREVRYTGERIAVDPNNENYVYVGTKRDGLYFSNNGANSWVHANGVPNSSRITDTDNAGYVGSRSVVIDARETVGSGSNLRSKIIYVGAYEDGIYQSTDGGQSFSKISGSPKTPRRMVLAGDGSLWVSTSFRKNSNSPGDLDLDSGRIFHYTGGQWLDKTPIEPDNRKPYGAIAIDPNDDNNIIVAWQKNRSDQPIYRTRNANNRNPTWENIRPSGSSEKIINPSWYKDYYFSTGPANIIFDGNNTNTIWMVDGFSVYHTSDIWVEDKKDITWTVKINGVEELVMRTLCTPPAPNPTSLFSGAADGDGFAHNDLNAIPESGFKPNDWATTDLDYVESDPRKMVRLLTERQQGGQLFTSTDSGATWDLKSDPRPTTSNKFSLGKVAVSATSLNKMVVAAAYNFWDVPGGRIDTPLRYTTDGGSTWNDSDLVLNPGPSDNWWIDDHPLVADKVDGNTFYFFYKRRSEFYRSTDGGATFDLVYTFPDHQDVWGKPTRYYEQFVQVRTVPGSAREVWINLPLDGLFRSLDGGSTWTRIQGFEDVRGVTFGKEAPGKSNPSLYVVGNAGDGRGLFTSDDMGQTWRRCDDDRFNFGLILKDLEADRQNYGRVFIATGGQGIIQANRNGTPPLVDFKPIARFSMDVTSGDKPLTVAFDASETVNADGGAMTYAWDFGDGSTGTGETVSHTFTEYGSYTVTLTATNDQGESNSTTDEVVVNAAPEITWEGVAQGDSFAVGAQVTFRMDITDTNGTGDIEKVFVWNGNYFNWWQQPVVAIPTGPNYEFTVTIKRGANRFLVEANDLQGAKGFSEVLTVYGGDNYPDDFFYGVNCGGGAFQDAEGNLYNADEAYSGGFTFSTSDAISGTDDDVLYQTERNNNALYRIPVINGSYDVVLKFAEIGLTQNGRRFNVQVEGNDVLTNLDIHSLVGHDNAYDVTLSNVIVEDTKIDIQLVAIDRLPKISAILIKKGGSSASSCSVPTGTAESNIQSSSALLNWDAADGAASYIVRYRVTGTSAWSFSSNLTDTQWTLNGLNALTGYEWGIRANCGSVNSSYSVTRQFTTSTNAPEELYLEAECGSGTGADWETVLARWTSGGAYVKANQTAASVPSNDDAIVTIPFEISSGGDYSIFGRVITPREIRNSVLVRFDNGEWEQWNTTVQKGWQWNRLPDAQGFAVGNHTVQFAIRDKGFKLDKLYVTNTDNVPERKGDTAANQCAPANFTALVTQEGDLGTGQLLLAPNPFGADGVLKIQFPDSMLGDDTRLQLFDLGGRLVFERTNLETTITELNQDDIQVPAGMYMITIRSKDRALTKRLLVR